MFNGIPLFFCHSNRDRNFNSATIVFANEATIFKCVVNYISFGGLDRLDCRSMKLEEVIGPCRVLTGQPLLKRLASR